MMSHNLGLRTQAAVEARTGKPTDDVWDGVKWMPTPRRTRPALDWDARPMIHAVGRLFACALVGTSLFMSAVTLAAVAAIALGGA